MSTIGPIASIRLKSQVIDNCWQYVYENFHKFNEQNKIKVMLAIISRDMPTKLEGDVGGGTKVIVVREKNATVSRDVTLSTAFSGEPS